jgi:choline kinase/phosphatidylglycerophosphate synthase
LSTYGLRRSHRRVAHAHDRCVHALDWRILRCMQPTRLGMDLQQPVTTALVVAAESSHRMRSPQPTVLRRVGGVSLLERSVRVLREAGVKRIVVVVGYRGEDVRAAVKDHTLPVEMVVNQDWELGTSTSVVAGIRLIEDARCLVVMGDHVFEADDVRHLMVAPGRNVLAVDHDLRRQVGGLGGVPPTRVRTGTDGRVLELAADLEDYDAVDAGLSTIQVADVLSAADGPAPATSWVALRQRLLQDGREMTTCDFDGLWAAVDTPAGVRALERVMWRRYGPKPTDGIIGRVVNRRISGPMTRQLLRTGITPDLATVLAFVATLVAAGLIATGDRWAMVAGGLGVVLGSALDGVDGELARVSGRASRRGATLDTLLDRYADLAVVLGLIMGTGATRTAWAWGFAAACGCLLVSYVHAIGRDTDVRLLFRREFRLLIFALAGIIGQPLLGLAAVAVAANLDVIRGMVLLLRAMRTSARHSGVEAPAPTRP